VVVVIVVRSFVHPWLVPAISRNIQLTNDSNSNPVLVCVLVCPCVSLCVRVCPLPSYYLLCRVSVPLLGVRVLQVRCIPSAWTLALFPSPSPPPTLAPCRHRLLVMSTCRRRTLITNTTSSRCRRRLIRRRSTSSNSSSTAAPRSSTRPWCRTVMPASQCRSRCSAHRLTTRTRLPTTRVAPSMLLACRAISINTSSSSSNSTTSNNNNNNSTSSSNSNSTNRCRRSLPRCAKAHRPPITTLRSRLALARRRRRRHRLPLTTETLRVTRRRPCP